MSDDMRTDDSTQEPTDGADAPRTDGPGDPGSGARRLTRRTDDRLIGGVAAGLARYFGIDPLVSRLVFVGLGLYGGLGVLLYLAGWVLIPAEDDGESPRTKDGLARIAGVGLIVIAVLVLLRGIGVILGLAPWSPGPTGLPLVPTSPWTGYPGPWLFRPGVVILALLLIGAGVLLYRVGQRGPSAASGNGPGGSGVQPSAWAQGGTGSVPAPGQATSVPGHAPPTASPQAPGRGGESDPTARAGSAGARTDLPSGAAPATPVPTPPPETAPDPGGGGTVGPPPAAFHEPPPPSPPSPPRPPSPLGRLTVALALVVVGVAALLERTGVLNVRVADLLAITLLLVGLGLIVGAWWGRARWLIAVGFALVPFVVVAAILASGPWVRPGMFEAGAQVHRFQSPSDVPDEFVVATGVLVLDFRALELPPGEEVSLAADVVAGELRVLLPPETAETAAVINASTLLGEVSLPDWQAAGFVVQEQRALAGSGGTINLDLSVRVGIIEVDRMSASLPPPPAEPPGGEAPRASSWSLPSDTGQRGAPIWHQSSPATAGAR